MKPDNVVDKYAVFVKKNDVVVGHLLHRKNGNSLRWYLSSTEQVNMQNKSYNN